MYLGADLSLTGSGLVIIDESCSVIATEKLTTKSFGVDRLFLLEQLLLTFLNTHNGILLCCIEGPALRELGRLFDIGEWTGVFKLCLFKKGIPYIIAAPLQAKKFISGVGKNLGKSTVLLDIYKNYGIEFRDNDIGDAFVLSLIARSYHLKITCGKKIDIKQYQLDVLNMIKKKEDKQQKTVLL